MKSISKQHALSGLCIGFFIFIAFASVGPDGSTNTSVAISNCMHMPDFNGVITVNVTFKQKTGEPIFGANGRLYLVDQETNPNFPCEIFTGSTSQQDFITNASGQYTFTGFQIHHNNSEDLVRVEVVIDKSSSYTGCRIVQVNKYNNVLFNFNCVGLKLEEL
ncbi:MAG: hypothetical protein ABJC12_07855 [Saprospiraceae bacterium]